MVGEREIKRGNSFSKRMFNQKFDLPEGIDIDGICSEMTRDGKLVISAPQKKTQVVAAAGADEGTKEVTKTGEEVVSTTEGEIQLEGGGTAKTSGSSTSKKSKEVLQEHSHLN